MLLVRLLSTALCAAIAACVIALVHVAPPAHVCQLSKRAAWIHALSPARDRGGRLASAEAAERSPGGMPVNVIDVAAGVPAEQVAALIPLAPGEQVAAVNGRAPAGDVDAGAMIASGVAPDQFLDLTVASAIGERRVLVLLH